MIWSPLIVSLKTASAALVLTFFLGLFAARYVAGLRDGGWKFFLDCLFTLPLVLPPTVLGFLLLIVFGANRPAGRFILDAFGYRVAFSWGATVLAAAVASFPLMYRAARGALEQVDPNLLDGGRALGLSEWRVFWHVSLPAALPGVAAGAVLAFVRGVGEFGATAMLAGNIEGRTRTLPLAVYSAVAGGDMDSAGVMVLALVALSFAAVAAMNTLASGGKRKQGEGQWRGTPRI